MCSKSCLMLNVHQGQDKTADDRAKEALLSVELSSRKGEGGRGRKENRNQKIHLKTLNTNKYRKKGEIWTPV